ncbi:MAG TPA: SpoIVB peptidase S55 domain-containing protein [Candidatus Acidoferrum sp.]|nr:SpoIVB peptidase S55 domain-containing protein [Candidatus Acidoferrum sp.]
MFAPKPTAPAIRCLRQSWMIRVAATIMAVVAIAVLSPALSAQSTDILPLSQVRPGMQGYAFTIFAGDQIEKFDLEVIGVMPNFLGPQQSIILVQLKGEKVEHTGVVAGMSGSPVYLDGKLAGALSLKLGVFTKEAIGGVTPIEDILHPAGPNNATPVSASMQPQTQSPAPTYSSTQVQSQSQPQQVALPLPRETASHNGLPSGSSLEPIATPLVFSGFQSETLRQFAPEIATFGFVAAQGGTAAPQPDDKKLVPGDMAGMVLVSGDASINSACTVTAVQADRVYLCGHPFLSLGDVALPMARSRVVTTLSSSLASTKIVNVGGPIGTITGDHLTAVTGKLGATPTMIPLDLSVSTPLGNKKLHFEVVDHPKLTPLLIALTTFNGLTQNSVYGEGMTLHLSGEIRLKGHAPVQIENTYAPGDFLGGDGLPIALSVQAIFNRLFTNTYEVPSVEGVALKVESIPGRQSFTIDSAWLEKGEAAPGENLRVRVLLHPYRGESHIEETTVHVPDQIARGTMLRVMVTDGDLLNRASRGFQFSGSGGPPGLDQLIALLNRERRNDRLYVGLFMPSPTILWDDKELPNAPLSQINVIDGRPAPGTVQVLRESLASESSVQLTGPVSGVVSLNLQIR